MLPHKHFLIAGFFIAVLALIARLDLKTAILWILIGGFVSMIIDIDSIILLAFTKNRKLMRFKSIREIFTNFDGLISAFRETGKLMLLSATHSMISIVIVIITLFFFGDWLVPVLAGVVSHLFSDLGYV